MRLGPRTLLLGIIPVVLLLSAIGLGAFTQRTALIDLVAYEEPLQQLATVTSLIDAIDAERDASLDVRMKRGGNAPERTVNQASPLADLVAEERELTNAALDRLSLGSSMRLNLSEVHRDLNAARIRSESSTTTMQHVQGAYDQLIDTALIDLDRVSPPAPPSAARSTARYLALVKARARAGVEYRAGLGLALTETGRMSSQLQIGDPESLSKLQADHEVELIYLREFVTGSTPESFEAYKAMIESGPWRSINELRARVFGRFYVGEIIGAVATNEWREQSLLRLDLLTQLRDDQFAVAQGDLSAAVDSARRQLWLFGLLSGFGLLLLMLATNLARRSVARPLAVLNGAAIALSAGRVHPVEDSGNDELSVFAEVFGKLHDQLSELWSEAQRVGRQVGDGVSGSRFDESRYKGDWQALVVGFNDTLQASEDAAASLVAESNRRRCLAEIASRAVGASGASAVATVAIDELSRLPGVSRCFLGAHPATGSIDRSLARAVRVGRSNTHGVLSMFANIAGPTTPLARLVIEWSDPVDDDEWTATERTLEAAARMVSQTSRRQAAETMVQYQSSHDIATGLPTLESFQSWVEVTVENPASRPLTVIALQLDGLSAVRGTAGQELADLIVTVSADRLRASTNADALIARASSDQFLIGLPGAEQPEQPSERLALSLRAPIESRTGPVGVEITAGYAVADSVDAAMLVVQNALAACAEAAQHHRSEIVAFSTQIRSRLDRQVEIERWFDTALAAPDQLAMWYQPIVDAHAGHIVGYEALVRGFDTFGQSLSPAEFVPVVEKTARIHELGRFATARVLRDISSLPGDDHYVSVNVSPQEIHRGDLVDRLDRLDWSGIMRSRLAIEITEGLALIDDEPVMEALHELEQRGHRIIIDDFGTGYSSLGYLNRLPVSIVKIDRSLIANIDSDETQSAIAAAAIEMAHATGSTVVAEGVERHSQLEVLQQLRCDLVQGYLTGQPAPVSDPSNHNPSLHWTIAGSATAIDPSSAS